MTQKTLKQVLVVDDDRSIRQLLCTLIGREELSVDCVADGAAAIEKLTATRYSIILLDLMMPGLDGFGVIEHLSKALPQPKPIVFVISAYADQSYRRVDPNIVAGVVHKPFDVIELGAIVKQCAEEYAPAFRDFSDTETIGRTERKAFPNSHDH